MSKNIQATMSTPGWAEIKAKAEQAVKTAHYEAMSEQDPALYPEKHRIAWAATKALRTFIEELEAESEGA